MIFAEYIRKLQAVLEAIAESQAENIGKAGRIVADSLSAGGIIHTFGTGHSHIIAEDVFFRAGGVAAINPILDERFLFLRGALESTRAERESGIAKNLIGLEKVEPQDAAILISNSGRNAAPVEMAFEMKDRGVPLIAITSIEQAKVSTPRHMSGRRLFEIADVVIDNCVPPGDALVHIGGFDRPTGASSTVAGSAIVHSVIIEALAELAGRGIETPILPSANMEATDSNTIKDVLRPFAGRIRYIDLETEFE